MQVKVCPKCGAENREASAACSNCYSSLDGVSPTESTKASQPIQPRPAVARPPKTTPAPAPTQQMPASSQQTQMGTAGPPPGMPQRLPDGAYVVQPKRTSTALIVVIVLAIVFVVFGGIGYLIASQLGLLGTEPAPTEQPDKVVLAFLEAKRTRAITRVEPYLTEESLDLINNFLNTAQGRSAGFGRKEIARMFLWDVPPTPDDLAKSAIKTTVLKDDPLVKTNHGRAAVVRVELEMKMPVLSEPMSQQPGTSPPPGSFVPDKDAMGVFKPEFEYVLYVEKGKWKVDLQMSTKRSADRLRDKLLNGQ
jgi:hypothetical protein